MRALRKREAAALGQQGAGLCRCPQSQALVLTCPSMSGAMGNVGQMAEYTPKNTSQSSMLPQTAR